MLSRSAPSSDLFALSFFRLPFFFLSKAVQVLALFFPATWAFPFRTTPFLIFLAGHFGRWQVDPPPCSRVFLFDPTSDFTGILSPFVIFRFPELPGNSASFASGFSPSSIFFPFDPWIFSFGFFFLNIRPHQQDRA